MKRGVVHEPPRKADLRKIHPPGTYPSVEDKAALQLSSEYSYADNPDAACVSWAAQERAMNFYNKHGLAATLDEIFRLRASRPLPTCGCPSFDSDCPH